MQAENTLVYASAFTILWRIPQNLFWILLDIFCFDNACICMSRLSSRFPVNTAWQCRLMWRHKSYSLGNCSLPNLDLESGVGIIKNWKSVYTEKSRNTWIKVKSKFLCSLLCERPRVWVILVSGEEWRVHARKFCFGFHCADGNSDDAQWNMAAHLYPEIPTQHHKNIIIRHAQAFQAKSLMYACLKGSSDV